MAYTKQMKTFLDKIIEVDELLKIRAEDAGYKGVDINRFAEELADDIILNSFPEGLVLPNSWTYENKLIYIAKKGLL